MFNFFRRQPQQDFSILYRYASYDRGPWFARTIVTAASNYEACRKFDTDSGFRGCTRVSCVLARLEKTDV